LYLSAIICGQFICVDLCSSGVDFSLQSPAMNRVNLLYPEWQSTGAIGVAKYEGARLLAARLPQLAFTEVNVDAPPANFQDAPAGDEGILNFDAVMQGMQRGKDAVAASNADAIFTVGGTCAVSIAPASWLNARHAGDLAMLWFDAHGDLNTPQSSPSARFHGMPLRVLMGEGDPRTTVLPFLPFKPAQVAVFGARDLDPPEAQFIDDKRVMLLAESGWTMHAADAMAEMRQRGFTRAYIHCDLDVLDPSEFPFCAVPAAHGITLHELLMCLSAAAQHFQIAGVAITAFKPQPNHTDFRVTDAVMHWANTHLM
jgi:arginase